MRNFSLGRWAALCALLASPFAYSQSLNSSPPPPQEQVLPELVVTATRVETPAEQIGSSVTVITAEEIEKSQKQSVAEILRTVPGLDVVRSGGPGQSVSIFTRGTESNHTLVLIDGIEAVDPSVPGNQFDFSALQVDDIERIEIVRGPQSTLYGSDAIGGVIQIFTRRGANARSHAQVEGGSFGSHAGRGGVHGGDEYVAYGMTFNLQETDGVSAFSGGEEDDAYENTTLSAYVNAKPSDESTLDFSLRRIEFDTNIDNFDSTTFAFADDSDTQLHTEQWLARAQGGYRLLDGRWNQRLGLSWTDHDRESENGPEPGNTTLSMSEFSGRKTKFDWVHDFKLDTANVLTFGLETEKEKAQLSGDQNPETGTDGIFLQDQISFTDEFFATVGVRRDKHDDFGSETTYRIAPAYLLKDTDTRLRASYGTGFKAPSLSELYESFAPFFLANSDLKPERSRGWDLGVEQGLLDGDVRLTATYFHNNIEDLITSVSDPVTFTGSFDNVDEAETKGYELSGRFKVLPELSVGIEYTHTKATDETTGEDLLRRPRKKAMLFADWQALPELGVNLTGRHIGERDDMNFDVFPFQRVTLDSYNVFDLAFAYTVNTDWTLQTRVENAFDEGYEEAFGLGTQGRAWYAGVRFTP